MSRLVIYGAGSFGREVWSIVEHDHDVAFCDDAGEGSIYGCPVISGREIQADDEVFLAIADPVARGRIANRLAGRRYRTILAPSAIIAPAVGMGLGCFFGHFTHAAVGARIGDHVVCHVYAYVGHDNVIGTGVMIGPRAGLNGHVTVGDYAYIGAGAVIRQGVTIGAHAVVGMGAVVTKDVAPGSIVVGNPARPIARPAPHAVHQ